MTKATEGAPAELIKLVPRRPAPVGLDDILRHLYALVPAAHDRISKLSSLAFGNAKQLDTWLAGTRQLKITMKVKSEVMKQIGLKGGTLDPRALHQMTLREPLVASSKAAMEMYYPLLKLMDLGAFTPVRLTFLNVQKSIDLHEHYLLSYRVGANAGVIMLKVRPRLCCQSSLLAALGLDPKTGLLLNAISRRVPGYESRNVTRHDLAAVRTSTPKKILEAVLRVDKPAVPTFREVEDTILKRGLDPVQTFSRIRCAVEEGHFDVAPMEEAPRVAAQGGSRLSSVPSPTEESAQRRARPRP